MIHDIIKPLAPTNPAEWRCAGDIRHIMRSAYPVVAWFHPEQCLQVFSAVEVAVDTGGFSKGPEYHISISKLLQDHHPERCSQEEAAWVLKAFGGLDGWEEDNHVPNGKVRNFWRAVAEPMIEKECPCKETETVIVEGDYEHRPMDIT